MLCGVRVSPEETDILAANRSSLLVLAGLGLNVGRDSRVAEIGGFPRGTGSAPGVWMVMRGDIDTPLAGSGYVRSFGQLMPIPGLGWPVRASEAVVCWSTWGQTCVDQGWRQGGLGAEWRLGRRMCPSMQRLATACAKGRGMLCNGLLHTHLDSGTTSVRAATMPLLVQYTIVLASII